jgi:hypothetical protein
MEPILLNHVAATLFLKEATKLTARFERAAPANSAKPRQLFQLACQNEVFMINNDISKEAP